MGCIQSHDKMAAERSRQIDLTLRSEAEVVSKQAKLLLLGAGESGKSTFLKQLRIICGNGYSAQECLGYRDVVHSNAIQSLLAIIRAMGLLKLNFSQPDRMADAKKFLSMVTDDSVPLNSELGAIMKRLWRDASVQNCFRRSSEYQLNDSAEYFLNSLDHISHPLYIPTDQDILRTRVKTSGIIEQDLTLKGINFKVIDIGGQRPERRKWISCFESVTAIIFFAALSEYDMRLREDQEVNRMEDSMRLFGSMCNNVWFKQTAIILFLNKKDIFATKIWSSPLSIGFPEYTGANTYEEAGNYIRHRYESLNDHQDKKEVYTHFTCSTDTNNIEFVLVAVTDIVLRNNLKDCGLL